MPQIERRLDPNSPENDAKTQEMVRTSEDARRAIKDRLNPYKAEIIIQVDPRKDFPLRTVHVGDTHFSHDASNIGALDEAVKQVGEDGIMITHSNIIEGLSGKFISTNTVKTGFTLDEQEMIVKSKLAPVDRKRHLIAVGGNTCHEGWAVKTATSDPIPHLVGPDTPLVYTGGQVIFEKEGEPGVRLGSVEVYHNGGEGRTKQSPEGSMRARSREIPVGHPDRPKALVDAHMHQLTDGQDVFRNPVTRKDVVTTFGEVGAAKGTKEHPDGFLVGLGVPPRNQPADAGEGLGLIWKKKGKEVDPYPVSGYDRLNLMFGAESLWENAQRTGNFDEFRQMILEKEKAPSAKLNKEESETRKKEQALKIEGKAPVYKVLSYDIPSKLPIRIQFMANLRVGSSSTERTRANAILAKAADNPWAFVFATRRLIDQGVSGQGNREDVLESMAKLLGHAKESLLGVMLTDELMSHRWAKKIKDTDRNGRKRKSQAMVPGDWLYGVDTKFESPIKGKPLIMPETVAFMKVGGVDYTLYLRDKLSHFTSLINPAHGLTRIQEIWGIDADVLVGGHTEIVGWRTWMRPWGQLEVVVPGGFSEYIEKGVGSRVGYPEGGQGVILFPNKKTVFSFATHQDGVDMHDAVWLQEGLRNMGKLEEISTKLQKTRE